MDNATHSTNDLSPEEIAFIADHLAESAAYLTHLSELWLEEGDDQVAEFDLPGLTADEALVLRQKVFGRLQRDNFAAKTVKFSTEGLLQVLLAMVRPLIGSHENKD
jgi:hypothetical protein